MLYTNAAASAAAAHADTIYTSINQHINKSITHLAGGVAGQQLANAAVHLHHLFIQASAGACAE